ncbi:hypothetical protein [Salipiger mucosus]|uniref:Uncharacterized protein n=1 Tax=Salipiger mucosus DSM 16094 TaxID=1123237 RepID=S9QTQ9_9RHOB|nr:hypothetical protein [Salipiger mucosus]EPX84746.1 hypothetical protein Salmuc_01319 [Salipiger mucosus DSM 16094]
MGSFNATCAVSGLPVEYDDEVRLIFLAKAPRYGRRGGGPAGILMNAHDSWAPICCPMKGRYEDYGKVAVADPKDPVALDFQCLLAAALSELGEGANAHQEPATAKMDMFDLSLVQGLCKKDRVFAEPVAHLKERTGPVPVGYMLVHEDVYQGRRQCSIQSAQRLGGGEGGY